MNKLMDHLINRQELIHQMNYLYNLEHVERKNVDIELKKLRKRCIEYLELFPEDFEFNILYAIAEYVSFGGLYDSMEDLKKIVLQKPDYSEAILLLAYIIYVWETFDEDTFELVKSINSSDKEIMSLRELFMGYYYQKNCNDEKAEECFIESIKLCNSYVQNYIDLGELYKQEGKDKEAKELIIAGLENLQKVHSGESPDIINIQKFFDIYITQKDSHEVILENLQKKYDIDFKDKIEQLKH